MYASEADEAREQIQKLLVTGRQPAEAGRRPGEGARRATSRRSSWRARRGSRTRSGRSSRSGSPTSSGSLENRLDPRRLTPDVVLLGRLRGRPGSGAAARRRAERRPRARPRRAGRRGRRPPAGRTRAGRRPASRRPSGPHAIASSSAWPNGSTRLGWQRTSRCGEVARDLVVRHAARRRSTPGRPSSCARSGPSPTNVERPSPSAPNASASRTTFLRSISEPTQTNAGRCGPSAPRERPGSARGRRRSRRPPSCRAPRGSSPRARGAGSRRPRSRAEARRDDEARRGARCPGYAPMLRTSRPCAVTTSGAPPASAAISPVGTRKCA